MRMTFKFSTAGTGGFMTIPCLSKPAEEYTAADGKLDEEKLRRELAGCPSVQMSDKDGRSVLSFCAEFLDRVTVAVKRLTDSKALETVEYDKGGKPKGAKTSAMRRFDKGRICYARVDVRAIAGQGFRVKIDAANPREVVGETEEFARLFAQALADNAVAIADALKEDGVVFDLQEGEGCVGVFAEARRRNDAFMLAKKYEKCEYRRGEYCSPCQFACPLYAQGKCRYGEVAKG